MTIIKNKFRKNYFLLNMIDLDKSLYQYLKDADYNYVIIYKNNIDVWEGDRSPVIYSDEIEILNEIGEDEDRNNYVVMTEQDFILSYCYSELEKYLVDKIKEINYFDGVCYVVFLDGFNNTININDMTDILSVHYGGEANGITFVISNDNDTKQSFATLNEFPIDVIINVIEYIENKK